MLVDPAQLEQEMRWRLQAAYNEIDTRVERARSEEVQFASEVMNNMHAQLRVEASQVVHLLNSNLNTENQLRHAEHIIERELSGREEEAFWFRFSEGCP